MVRIIVIYCTKDSIKDNKFIALFVAKCVECSTWNIKKAA